MDDAAGGGEQRAEFSEPEYVYTRALVSKRFEEGNGVDVAGGGKTLFEHGHQAHLIGELQAVADDERVGAETFFFHPRRGEIGIAARCYHFPDAVESELRFKF